MQLINHDLELKLLILNLIKKNYSNFTAIKVINVFSGIIIQ
jgi:hypothetical protein